MSVNLKDINELPVKEELNGTEKVLLNDNGEAKAFPARKFTDVFDAVISANVPNGGGVPVLKLEKGTFEDLAEKIKSGTAVLVGLTKIPNMFYFFLSGEFVAAGDTSDITGEGYSEDCVIVVFFEMDGPVIVKITEKEVVLA